MGIYGLKMFINRNSIQYFENLQLKNGTLVIIDGSALIQSLYRVTEKNSPTSAFGGDYNILPKVYTDFINLFTRRNVTPIFLFDSGYEERKIETIMVRKKQKI